MIEILPKAVTDYNIEVFITKDDKRIVKQDTSLAVDPNTFVEEMNKVVPEEEKTELPESIDLQEVTLAVTSQLGQSVSIEAPQNATPVDEVMTQVQSAMQQGGGPFSAAHAQGQDAMVQSELSSMRSEAELYYTSTGNSYSGFCEGNTADGADPYALYQSATDDGATDGHCATSEQAWAASAQLNSGSYFCVDSTGFAGEVEQAPSGVSCNGDQAAASPETTHTVGVETVARSAFEAVFTNRRHSLATADVGADARGIMVPATAFKNQATSTPAGTSSASTSTARTPPVTNLLSVDMLDSVTLPAAAIGIPF